ncbi:DUF397 domain-containing protein [Streptomyces sp. WMMC905]|uniref:DUF397 domain-containing protein n=1 Tax=Streptomyces sp. WMMC905 TaxID=3404123 RepID=UPI003B93C7E8
MNAQQLTRLNWFKSSYSSGEGGACVEIAADRAAVRVRDTKEQGTGPQLAFTHAAWAGFVADLGRDGI